MADFQSLFGRNPTVTADAPGRVNLIGEHTDYNGGFVLPMAIPQRTRVELAPRQDRTVRVWSSDKAATDGIVGYTLGAESPRKDWLDYIQGVTQILRKERQALPGFDARIESTVPLGSGVSSSASLTVSLMRALRQAFALISMTWQSPGLASARKMNLSVRGSASWTPWPPAWRTSIRLCFSMRGAWPMNACRCHPERS
jgi:galactokinase